jgi:RHH-type rel operon transcriptional repressor/antitoxin RelB
MPHRLSIRLGADLAARLARIARLTKRSKSFHVRQALADQIEDFEDLYLARKVARRVADGHEGLVPLAELERTPRADG